MKDKEKELIELFTILNNEINALSSAGAYRSMIIKINSVLLNNKLNDVNLYKYNAVAYKMYVQTCANYITKITDIVNFYNDPTRNVKGKEYHKFGFFTSNENRDIIVKMCESHTNVQKWRLSIWTVVAREHQPSARGARKRKSRHPPVRWIPG